MLNQVHFIKQALIYLLLDFKPQKSNKIEAIRYRVSFITMIFLQCIQYVYNIHTYSIYYRLLNLYVTALYKQIYL